MLLLLPPRCLHADVIDTLLLLISLRHRLIAAITFTLLLMLPLQHAFSLLFFLLAVFRCLIRFVDLPFSLSLRRLLPLLFTLSPLFSYCCLRRCCIRRRRLRSLRFMAALRRQRYDDACAFALCHAAMPLRAALR